MKLILPYLTTRMDTDLLLTFFLTPLWWLTGFNIFVYQFTAGLVLLKLLVGCIRSNEALKFHPLLLIFLFFLFSYFISLCVNFTHYPEQRVFASINNYFVLIMGFFLMVAVGHVRLGPFLFTFSKICYFLSLFVGLTGVFFLALWIFGNHEMEMPTLLGKLIPSLLQFPFFYMFLVIRVISSDWLFMELPRLSIFSGVCTATGGFLLGTLPLAAAYLKLGRKKNPLYYLAFLPALVALVFSLSRTSICGLLAAIVFVWFFERRHKGWIAILALLVSFLTSGFLYDAFIWLLKVRSVSTTGRLHLYIEALRLVAQENLFFGIGVRPREGFTMMAVGSHSTYVGFLLVTGVFGLSLFILFQMAVLRSWISQSFYIKNSEQKIWWKYLGMSFVGTSLWFFTDPVDSLPFIAYGYFIVTAAILSLPRMEPAPSALSEDLSSNQAEGASIP